MKYRFDLENGSLYLARFQMEGDELTPWLAMRLSIDKWIAVESFLSQGHEVYQAGGTHTCGLCHLYHRYGCMGCPVSVESGQAYCSGTPFEDWDELVSKAELDDEYPFEEALYCAQAERKYLEGLIDTYFEKEER